MVARVSTLDPDLFPMMSIMPLKFFARVCRTVETLSTFGRKGYRELRSLTVRPALAIPFGTHIHVTDCGVEQATGRLRNAAVRGSMSFHGSAV